MNSASFLCGRTVVVVKPGPAHGMEGQVIGWNDDGRLVVSLHGESEQHEGSVGPFWPTELLLVQYRNPPRKFWEEAAKYGFAFVFGLCAGVIFAGWSL